MRLSFIEYHYLIKNKISNTKNKFEENKFFYQKGLNDVEQILEFESNKEIMQREIKVIERSNIERKKALKRANWKCEYNPNHFTFEHENGYNYVEVHHLVPLNSSLEGDVNQNLVCLCPNCHQFIHRGKKEKKSLIPYLKTE